MCVIVLISDSVGDSSQLAAVASRDDWHDFVWSCSSPHRSSGFQK